MSVHGGQRNLTLGVWISTMDKACWVPGWISYPEGEIFLSCMDWHRMDSFSPTFNWIVPGNHRVMWDRSFSYGQKKFFIWANSLSHIGKGGRKRSFEYCSSNTTPQPLYNTIAGTQSKSMLSKLLCCIQTKRYTVMVLKFRTPKFIINWHMQTVQIQIRLLLRSSLIRIYTVCHFIKYFVVNHSKD